MNKELTADEVFLLDYVKQCNSSYKLYKLYDSEEEIDDRIPDIWNVLLDMLDETKKAYDEARLEHARKDASSAYWYRYYVTGCKEGVDSINRLMELVEKSSADYFAFCEETRRLVPINKQPQNIYKATVVEGKLSFEATGETIDVWTPESRFGGYTYSIEYDGRRVWVNGNGFNTSDYYVFTFYLPNLEILNYNRQIACTDCGRIFQLNSGEVNFYTRRGLELPKRCPTCRDIRKVTRECKKSQGTSYFEKMMQYI